ncbi:hypothetical protein E4T47_00341 [Aureobasidium subglaciale]|nr:hypothetical protein E4T47_00341 [Aureobasidium subglaciale]
MTLPTNGDAIVDQPERALANQDAAAETVSAIAQAQAMSAGNRINLSHLVLKIDCLQMRSHSMIVKSVFGACRPRRGKIALLFIGKY